MCVYVYVCVCVCVCVFVFNFDLLPLLFDEIIWLFIGWFQAEIMAEKLNIQPDFWWYLTFDPYWNNMQGLTCIYKYIHMQQLYKNVSIHALPPNFISMGHS